ncbi:hypothetical protein [Janthinobacterium sp. PAMC25594]|uniref:hypothetical protein n=1 Tax=Janthinobacterium sp. PAMC25594 TaxID=2861284 RepID=UPI001C62C433|nr:hypothetical protein [Janthinobacterium sp. PAMC25594]QYG06256.1 hypothetical protein KY494_23780 [Janthinobacterium sp. PAMC25594]
MAKKINENWALIESMGYTIQRTLGGDWPVPLLVSVSLQIGDASGWASSYLIGRLNHFRGIDVSKRALRPVSRAKAIGFGNLDGAQWLAAKHCGDCADCYGFLCLACATSIITPELARECNGEVAWAAARKGSALDKAMATMIAATPALQAEIERRAFAALIPATPTATRRQSGRL